MTSFAGAVPFGFRQPRPVAASQASTPAAVFDLGVIAPLS